MPRQSSSGLTSPSTRAGDDHAGDALPLEGDLPGSQVPDRALIDPDLAGEQVPHERLADPSLTGERDADAAHLGGDPIRPGERDAAHGDGDVLGGRLRDAAHPNVDLGGLDAGDPALRDGDPLGLCRLDAAVGDVDDLGPRLAHCRHGGRSRRVAAAGADVVAAREAVAVGCGRRFGGRGFAAEAGALVPASRLRRRRSRRLAPAVAWRPSFAPASPSASLAGRRRPWLDRRSRVDRSWT